MLLHATQPIYTSSYMYVRISLVGRFALKENEIKQHQLADLYG
jgi:hypothetical protein